MTILHACIETHPLITQMFLQVLHQYIGFFRCDVSGRMVFNMIAFNANDVTTHCHLARFQIYTDAGSFQRSSSFINFRQVIAQNGHIRDLTTGMETIGNSFQPSRTSHARQFIHIRRFCILQERLVSQRLYSPVGHSVTQYDDVFHKLLFYTFAMLIMSANTPAAVTPAPAPYP